MTHFTTSIPSSEAPQRIGTLGELDAIAERARAGDARLAQARRLGGFVSSNLLQLEKLRAKRHPNQRTLAVAVGRLERRVTELTESMGLLMAEAQAEVASAIPHVANAASSARIDSFLADQLRLSRAGLTEDSLVSEVA